jgi:hypothetical protein
MGLARRANLSNDLSYLNTAQPEEEEIDGRWGRKGRTHFWRNSIQNIFQHFLNVICIILYLNSKVNRMGPI